MLGREISEIPIYCAQLSARGEIPSDEDRQILVDYTNLSSWIAEKRFGGTRFRRVEAAPGYLCIKVGQRNYFVPYGLVSVFPDEQQLESVDHLVDEIRLSSESSFCLSGSGTFIGQISCISDIDFCEYFHLTNAELTELLSGKIAALDDSYLVRVKERGGVHYFPFKQNGAFLSSEESDTDNIFKLDFVTKTESFGVIVATNLVLSIDSKFSNSETLIKSFQYQEAVVLESNAEVPKRPLIEPSDIGRYLNWLRQEATDYALESKSVQAAGESGYGSLAIKALKRALSWFLMVGLSSNIDEIITMLKKPEMVEVGMTSRNREVMRMLEMIPAHHAGVIRTRLTLEQKVHLELGDQMKIFFDNALLLAQDLLEEIDSHMDDAVGLEVAA